MRLIWKQPWMSLRPFCRTVDSPGVNVQWPENSSCNRCSIIASRWKTRRNRRLAVSLQLRGELENRLLKEQEQLGQNDAELKQRQKKGMTIAEIDLFEAQIGHHRRVISQLREGLGQLEEKNPGPAGSPVRGSP